METNVDRLTVIFVDEWGHGTMINRFFHHKENTPFFIGDDIILQHQESMRIDVAKTFAQAKVNKAFTFCQLLK